jgi:Domain of unknown function (DUF4845)
MQTESKRFVGRQSNEMGMSLLGMIFFAGLFVVFGLAIMKTTPSLVEYYGITKAVKRVSKEQTENEARASFERARNIDNFSSISGQDLDISTQDGKMLVSFAYRKEVPLAGPVSLVINYSGRSE